MDEDFTICISGVHYEVQTKKDNSYELQVHCAAAAGIYRSYIGNVKQEGDGWIAYDVLQLPYHGKFMAQEKRLFPDGKCINSLQEACAALLLYRLENAEEWADKGISMYETYITKKHAQARAETLFTLLNKDYWWIIDDAEAGTQKATVFNIVQGIIHGRGGQAKHLYTRRYGGDRRQLRRDIVALLVGETPKRFFGSFCAQDPETDKIIEILHVPHFENTPLAPKKKTKPKNDHLSLF